MRVFVMYIYVRTYTIPHITFEHCHSKRPVIAHIMSLEAPHTNTKLRQWELAHLYWENKAKVQTLSFFYSETREQQLNSRGKIEAMIEKMLGDEGTSHLPLLSCDEICTLIHYINTKLAGAHRSIRNTNLGILNETLMNALPSGVPSLVQHLMHTWVLQTKHENTKHEIVNKIVVLSLSDKFHLCTFMLHAIMEHSLRYRSEYIEVISLFIPSVIDILPLNSLVKDKFRFSRAKLLVDVLSEI